MADNSQQTKMNQSERNALVKVVRQRYALFTRYAERRRRELKRAIFERIMEESAADIAAAQAEMDEIAQRAEELRADAQRVVAKWATKGVALGWAKVEDLAVHKNGSRDDWSYEPTVVTSAAKGQEQLPALAFDLTNNWYAKDIAERVAAEYSRLEDEYNLGEIALARQESDLTEQIILGGVSSDEAQSFLEKVPTPRRAARCPAARRRGGVMGRQRLQLDSNRTLIFGYDPPFATFFVQLYLRTDPDDEIPHRAAGYAPAERIDPLHSGRPYGPYPLTLSQLDNELLEWGIGPTVRRKVQDLLR